MDSKITDHFDVGDKVEWVTVRHSGRTIDIRKHDGTIDEINGSKALINSCDFRRRRWVSLFELKKINHAPQQHVARDDQSPQPARG